jgi:hypothetical protein
MNLSVYRDQLFVCDWKNKRIQIFTLQGIFLGQFPLSAAISPEKLLVEKNFCLFLDHHTLCIVSLDDQTLLGSKLSVFGIEESYSCRPLASLIHNLMCSDSRTFIS